tara:strand:+ start:6656 stop:7672 length:1017 start_codon:yes stop_codon:yes gene_type:complete
MKARIDKIKLYVPDKILTNDDLSNENPEWDIDKIFSKIGISKRHIASEGQTSVDLAVESGKKLLIQYPDLRDKIDYLILCTQSPDYYLPTSACIVQDRLKLNNTTGAIDVNQGCSGFVYSLGLAKGLIESDQAKNILIITSETYSKFIHPKDKSVRTIFGDAAACTLVSGIETDDNFISSPVYGTDGSGYKSLIVPYGGMRNPNNSTKIEKTDMNNNTRTDANLFMDGKEVFLFTLKQIPKLYHTILDKEGLAPDDIDIFILHQANKFMLDSLKNKLKIPELKMHRSYQNYGNTVSSTIPIGLSIEKSKHSFNNNQTKTAMLLGFGVGLSWAGTIVKI